MFVGISAYNHESAVALVNSDGELIDYCKEESLSRIKGDKTFPKRSLEKLFKDNKLNHQYINKFIFYERPLSAFLHPLKVASKNLPTSIPLMTNQFRNFKKSSLICFMDLSKTYPGSENKLIYSDHHLSHTLTCLAYSDITSDVCSIVVDGFGDRSTASIHSVVSPEDIKELWNLEYPFSLGLFYSAITDFLGFAINEGEYKVMGLAAFGNPKSEFINVLEKLIYWDEKSKSLKSDMKYFKYHTSITDSYSKELVSLLGTPRNPFNQLLPDQPDFQRYADIAKAAQYVTEKLLRKIFEYGYEITGSKNFFFSGGVAMNSVSLKGLAELPFVNKIIVPPSPGDAGAAIGAAYYGFIKNNSDLKPIKKPSLFPSVSNFDKQVNQASKIISTNFDVIAEGKEEALNYCAKLINQGEIIGTVIGNSETGPRALGNRSLICDGKNHEAVKYLNTVIKNRSPFRPTAPVMTLDTAKKYYKLNDALIESYGSMTATCDCLKNSEALKFPVTHIDGTARLQIANQGSFIFSLLSLLSPYKIEILANSSLNISGDPTCLDFIDGLLVCSNSSLEYLITDYGLLRKKI
ncbi:MAG: hypothetical protein JJ837_01845 [Prochlorococcus marinus XMU1428]|nr:hypothetical protein [Prochlorococcus marinus XMU1428]